MKKAIEFILYLVGILYFPTIIIVSITADQSGNFFIFPAWFLSLILLFFSLHFFCVFLEVGFSLLRLFEKKTRLKGEKILNVTTLLIALFMLVITLIDPEREFNVLAILISHLLIALWIVGDIRFRQRKFFPEIFKKKYFWFVAASLFVSLSIVFAITGGNFDKGKPDPIEPAIETRVENEK